MGVTSSMAKSNKKKISAKIVDATPKNCSESYTILLGEELGHLCSQVSSTTIKSGYILESIIANKANLVPEDDLDKFINDCNSAESTINGTFLCTKSVVKNSSYYIKGHEPDLVIFVINENGRGKCYITELKAGSSFDTKKSDGEYETLEKCKAVLGQALPFITEIYLCSFHAENRQQIVAGLKDRFKETEVMTGRELCKILDIDYDEVITEEKQYAESNAKYFTNKVVRNAKDNLYKIPSEEFYPEEEEDDEEE